MIYIHYQNGRVLQGVVLAFGERLVRVAIQGSDDSSEFRMINQVWVSEDCEVVRIQFAEGALPVEIADDDLLDAMIRLQCPPVSLSRVM